MISTYTNIPEEIQELERQLPNKFQIYKDSLPKEPTDSDVKKEYYVGCYSADDWHFVHDILIQDGTLEDNIPDHSCECTNDCLHSATRGIYLLTDSEAEELRNSPRVEYVNINAGKYPGTYLQNPIDLITSGEVQQQRYSSSISNHRYFPYISPYYSNYPPDTYSVNATYPEMSRRFIVGIETNTTSTAYRTYTDYNIGPHRGAGISSTTDNPSFELESGDYFIVVNYDGYNNPIKIQTTTGIGGSAIVPPISSDIYYSTVLNPGDYQVIRWYTETPGTYYYQSENTSSMVGIITVTARDTVNSSLKDRCGYQILRHKEQQDPWSSATYNTAINDSLTQRGDGTDVDVIVADTLAWFGHIEFQNNLGGPKGYRGGNVLPGNGTCDLLDLVLDAPYYIDPDFFNANPSKLTTRWDGTIVPTDSAAHNWWENNSTSHRSAKFVSPANGGTAIGDNDFGTVAIDSVYLRENFGTHIEPNYDDEHGTGCASQAYGRQYGWAYNANKWYINLIGTRAIDTEVGIDIQKIFHKIKPINSKYGTKDPTISSNSWGFNQSVLNSGYYYFRSGDTGSNGVAFNVTNWYSGGSPEFITNHYSSNTIEHEMLSNSILTAGNELVDAGVIFVYASGNNNQKMVKADHPDYNNYYSQSDNTALASAAFSYLGRNYLNTINRSGFPGQIGATGSGTDRTYKAIFVGALDDYYQPNANSKESKVSYSSRGNLIDIWIAGDGTASAASPTYSSQSDHYRYIRPDQYYTIGGVQSRPSFDRRFSGTSAACPIFAGLLATKLQYQRDWTYVEVKKWISSLGEVDPSDFYYGTESTTADDSNWADYYSLQGAPAIVAWDKPTRDYDPLSITGNIDFRTNVSPDFEIIDLAANVDEGQSISPTIGATSKWRNLLVDTNRVYWDISGVSIASTDFSSVGADGNPDTGTFLSGYVDVNGTATSKQFPIGVSLDNYTDDPSGANINANETATLSIYSDSSRTQLLDSSNFTINDTSTSSNFEFLLVGGGGAGGRMSSSTTNYTSFSAAGGGGAGGVRVVSDSDIFNNHSNIWVEIGAGGLSSQAGESTYLKDTDTNGAEVYRVGGGGYGASSTTSTAGVTGGSAPGAVSDPRGSGGGGNRASYTQLGWTYSSGGGSGAYGNDGGGSQSQHGGGGGGGAGSVGSTRFGTTGGNGGSGYDLTNFFSELSGDGHNGTDNIAGGGGSGQSRYADGGIFSSSSSGSGNDGGGNGGGFANSGNGNDAAANTGAGGGGAAGTRGAAGGAGGSGIVYLKYTSEIQLVGNWTGTASDHTVTSYDQSVAGGTKRTWIHKMIGNGALSLL